MLEARRIVSGQVTSDELPCHIALISSGFKETTCESRSYKSIYIYLIDLVFIISEVLQRFNTTTILSDFSAVHCCPSLPAVNC
jgi:hypothetical protein